MAQEIILSDNALRKYTYMDYISLVNVIHTSQIILEEEECQGSTA
jgi:hypothetical protein